MINLVSYLLGVIITCFLFWFLLMLTDAWRLRRLRKKYNESEDLSKQGEAYSHAGGEIGGASGSEGRGSTEGELTPKGSNKPERRQLLPTTASKPPRKDSSSFRASVSRYSY
jgi:hypothetical protein